MAKREWTEAEKQAWLSKWEAILDCPQKYVIGIDEVGYGAWAGPVMVGAAVVERSWNHEDVTDSKVLSPETRRRLVLEVLRPPNILDQLVLFHDNTAIDRMRLGRARDELVVHAARRCRERFPDSLIVMDGNVLPPGLGEGAVCLTKADMNVPAVSAASIIAKECRDAFMRVMDDEYPQYDFKNNVGYGTPLHQHAIVRHGLCPIHRHSYPKLQELARR